MRPCYQGELAWDRFVPLTVPLSTNISSWPFRACSLPVAGGLPKHHLEKIGGEVESAPFRLTNQPGTTSVERKRLSVESPKPDSLLNEPHQGPHSSF